jgi:hypothetical protein
VYHATAGVSFDVLSYASVLGLTVVTDPDIVTEPDRLTSKLIQVFVILLERDHSRILEEPERFAQVLTAFQH